jgi:hypothetical protein
MQHERRRATRIAHREMHGDRGADSDARECHFPGNAQRVQQRPQVVGHVVPGDHTGDFLRQAGTSRVIAQHLAAIVERTQSLVPTVEGTAHLVDQNQGGWPTAAELVSQSGAVDFDPVHGERSPCNPGGTVIQFVIFVKDVGHDDTALVASFPLRKEGDDRRA